jgi:exopolyphosphatase/guanosine-5'-triphosphate,3'-diphosphate pyrophosphatase
MREAKNGRDVVRRVRAATGLELEVVSGREEARLICLGVLNGRPRTARSILLDIGGGSTEVATAVGEQPTNLWSAPLGAVRLTQIFATHGRVSAERLAALRGFCAEAFREALPPFPDRDRTAIGSSGTIEAVVGYAADGRKATRKEIGRAVEDLAEMSAAERRIRFDPRRAEVIVAGAAVLEAAMRHLGLAAITAVGTGLRNGILVELSREGDARVDPGATERIVALGRRFHFDEPHATQVARLALDLYDRLANVHRLTARARQLLEAAALLHDLGHAVSVHAHHKHTYYLVANADLPGFSDRERELVAIVARYHRRSHPGRDRRDLEALSASELGLVRKLVAILRVADALDRSHQQPVRAVRTRVGRRAVEVRVGARGPIELELWDAAREAALFQRVFGRRLALHPARA